MTFSLDSYRGLIESALRMGFTSIGFTDGPRNGRAVLLRHDVDYSLEMAVRLARVNSEVGVSGTFFILLRGHAYNALSSSSQERLQELNRLGQRLGLHLPPANVAELASDFELLSRHVPLDRVFAWHNPTTDLIEAYRDREQIEGLTNVYSRRFLEAAAYYSDSNLRYAAADLESALGSERGTIQLLIHPFNWVGGGASMLDVFQNTWPFLVRECELEARTNRVYSERLPDGMPDDVLVDFMRAWRKAVT